MITGTKKFILNGKPPYNWKLISTSSCVTIPVNQGVSDVNTITVTAEFSDEVCFETSLFTFTAIDAEGCTYQKRNFKFTNPCLGFSAGVINTHKDYSFSVSPTSTSNPPPQFTFNWTYDRTLFDLANGSSNTNSSIDLVVKEPRGFPPSYPQITTISVDVMTSEGCHQTVYKTVSICRPSLTSASVQLQCKQFNSNPAGTSGRLTSFSHNSFRTLNACGGIDWSTLYFIGVPEGVFIINNGDGTVNIYANTNATVGNHTITAYVKGANNVWSYPVNFSIYVPACPVTQDPTAIHEEFIFIDGQASVGSTYEVTIDEYAGSITGVDWDEFTFVPTTSQTLVSPTEITTPFGTIKLAPGRSLQYTLNAVPTSYPFVDIVQWRVKNNEGYYSNTGKVFFDFNVIPKPVANNDSMCASCGNTSTVDLLANDTGDIDPRSITIVSTPSKGGYSLSDSLFVFTALTNVSGSDTATYTVSNYDGAKSNQAIININIICAGDDNSTSECQGATVNFNQLLSSWATTGCTWSQSISNPATVNLSNPSSVDFTGKPVGLYTFTYTCISGTCVSSMTLEINIQTSSINNDCSSAISLPFPATYGTTGEIVACDNEAVIQSPAGSVQNPSTWNTSRSGDVWYKFSTTATSTYGKIIINGEKHGLAGIINPQVQLLSSSGSPCTVNDFTEISNNSEANGGQYLELLFLSLSPSTTYYIRVSSGEVANNPKGGIGKFLIRVDELT